MLTIEAKWIPSMDEMESLAPGAPRRNHAISEAIALAARTACNVSVACPGRSYRVTPEDSLQSVLERYGEGPGGSLTGQTWLGEPAPNKGETKTIRLGDS